MSLGRAGSKHSSLSTTVEGVTLLVYLNAIISSTVVEFQLKNHKLSDSVRPISLPLLSTIAHHLRRL
jgi:hypothetical protein